MEADTSFGYWLRRRRKALDLTQEALGQRVSCSTGMIRMIEADERRPSKLLAERLADCLELELEERVAFLKAARAELVTDELTLPISFRSTLPHTSRIGARLHGTLKGYALHEQIGAGRLGAVYRAEQRGIRREVAVKICGSLQLVRPINLASRRKVCSALPSAPMDAPPYRGHAIASSEYGT